MVLVAHQKFVMYMENILVLLTKDIATEECLEPHITLLAQHKCLKIYV